MSHDQQYCNVNYKLSEIEHLYGDKVHILSDLYSQSILAKLSKPETAQPLLNRYIEILYGQLFSAVANTCFKKKKVSLDTRMKQFNSEGVFHGEVLDDEMPAVVVNLARAGTYPSHLCFDYFNYLLDPQKIRQDHFFMQRKLDESGNVSGVDVSGSKIGGGQESAVVLFPDPMGATGGSLSYTIDYYKQKVKGVAHKYVAMHIIVTPEYIARMKKDHPEVEIFATRLDRGLSDEKTLQTIPGTFPEKEIGLNSNQYIVPGAGGVGEILNNSYC